VKTEVVDLVELYFRNCVAFAQLAASGQVLRSIVVIIITTISIGVGLAMLL
jgi:hypothetical protein